MQLGKLKYQYCYDNTRIICLIVLVFQKTCNVVLVMILHIMVKTVHKWNIYDSLSRQCPICTVNVRPMGIFETVQLLLCDTFCCETNVKNIVLCY